MDYFQKFMCIGVPQRFDDFSKIDHLSNVPDLVMSKILEKCEFSEIQNLRKTCKSFRKFIDDSKPDLKLFRISITAKNYEILLKFEEKSRKFDVKYRKTSGKFKMDYCSSFFKDLFYILNHQKSRIFNLEIDFDFEKKSENFEFSKKLEAILASRLRPLPVKFLRITVFDEDDVISILKNLEPGKLEIIQILNSKNQEFGVLNFQEIRNLEQWKKAKEFEFRGFLGAEPIGNFVHFERINIQLDEIQVDDVVLVKEAFLNSSIPKFYQIGFNSFPTRNHLHLSLGRSKNGNKWYFPLPVDQKSGQGVSISLNAFSITFNRIPMLKIC